MAQARRVSDACAGKDQLGNTRASTSTRRRALSILQTRERPPATALRRARSPAASDYSSELEALELAIRASGHGRTRPVVPRRLARRAHRGSPDVQFHALDR